MTADLLTAPLGAITCTACGVTLTAPSPLDEVVATVLGVDVAATIADGEQGMLEAVDRLNTELFHGTPAGHVVTLRKLGALAIQYLARNTKSPTS